MSAPTLREGYQNLLLSAGLGAMSPNLVVVELPKKAPVVPIGKNVAQLFICSLLASFAAEADEFVGTLGDIASVEKSSVVACNFDSFDFSTLASSYSVNIFVTRYTQLYSWDDFEGKLQT